MIQKAMKPTADPIATVSPRAAHNGTAARRRPGSDQRRSTSGDPGITAERLLSMVSRAFSDVRALESGIFKMPRPQEPIRLKPFEVPPEGAKVIEGTRGGRYFLYEPGKVHDDWLIRRRAHGGLGNVPEHLRENHPLAQRAKERPARAASAPASRPAAPEVPSGQMALPGFGTPPRSAPAAPKPSRRAAAPAGGQGMRKIYLRPGEKPPEGAQVYTGPRGGRYYLHDPNNPAHEEWLRRRPEEARAQREQVRQAQNPDSDFTDSGEQILLPPGELYPRNMYIPGHPERMKGDRTYEVRIGYIPPRKPAYGQVHEPEAAGQRIGFIKWDPPSQSFLVQPVGSKKIHQFRDAEAAHDWLIQQHRHKEKLGHVRMYQSLDSLLSYSISQASKAILLAEVSA